MPWLVAVVLAVALGAVLLRGSTETANTDHGALVYSSLEAPDGAGFHLSGTNPAPAKFSPDGTRVVYGARAGTASPDLWLQELSSPAPRRVPGTSGAAYEFWSRDGKSLGFFTGGALHVIDLATETRRQVATVAQGKGGCWTSDDQILFAASAGAPISKLDLETGDITEITDLKADPPANSHRHPEMLDDNSFLFVARLLDASSGSPAAVMVGHLDGSPAIELVRTESQASYVNGHLLYLNETNLIARPLDTKTLKFTGPPLTIATDVGRIPGASLALFSCSTQGDLVFHPGYSSTLAAKLVWYGADGKRQGEATELEAIGNFDVAPDGSRVAVEIWGDRSGLADLWMHNLETFVSTRLTFGAGSERSPQWSPDGRTLYYVHDGDSDTDPTIMALEPESQAEPRQVFAMPAIQNLNHVSPDGKWLSIVAADSSSSANHVYILPVDGSSPPIRVDEVAANTLNGRFTPDGRWIAYVLADEGGFKIYLKTNPPTNRKWQLTDQNAFWYDWAPEGDQIYFQGGGSELFVTEIDLTGTVPRPGQSRISIEEFPNPVTNLHDFQVGRDGATFYVSDAGATDDARPLRLVRGWHRLLDPGAERR